MAKGFVYKKNTTTSMKVVGYYDGINMSIDTEDSGKKFLKTLLSDFTGAEIEINVKIKNEEELDEPKNSSEQS